MSIEALNQTINLYVNNQESCGQKIRRSEDRQLAARDADMSRNEHWSEVLLSADHNAAQCSPTDEDACRGGFGFQQRLN